MSGGSSNQLISADEKPLLKRKIKLKPEALIAIYKGNEFVLEDDETSTIIQSPSIPTCPECFKSFRSVKSLHGHMRSHRDREYRGMVPPAKKKSSRRIKTYSVDQQVVVGCSGSVGSDLTGLWSRGWPSGVKKRRTCGTATGVAASSSFVKAVEDEEELMMGAAYGLLLLATGDERYRSLPSSRKGGIRVSEPSNEKARFDVNISSIGKKRKKCSQAMEMETMMMKSHQSKVLTEDGCGASLDPSHHVIVDESSAGDAASHVCKECSKGFLSGQALGGHMKLHFKRRLNVAVRDEAGVGSASYCFDLNEIPDDDEC